MSRLIKHHTDVWGEFRYSSTHSLLQN